MQRFLLRYLLLGLSVLALAACSSTPIKLYPGPSLAADKIATLKVPVEIEILSLNGSKVDAAHTLLGTDDQQLQLLPGDYKLLVYYNNIWKTGTKSHEKIKSAPVEFRLTLAANHTYVMDFKHATNTHEAQAFRQHFTPWITDTSNGARTPSKPSGLALDDSLIAQLTGKVKAVVVGPKDTQGNRVIAPLAAPAAASANAVPVPANRPTTAPTRTTAADATATTPAGGYLTLLKAQWSQASKAEKRAFLQWVGSH